MNLKRVVLTVLAALLFVACSDNGEDAVIARFDESGYQYSPRSISAVVEYLPTMKPSAVRVEVVDGQLNAVDTIELFRDTSSWNGKRFTMESQDLEYPLLRIVTEFPYGEKSKMEFSQYYLLSSKYRSYNISQNIFMALASSRFEHFVKKENYSFADAEDTVMSELSKRFSNTAYKIVTYEFPSYDIGFDDLLLYVICRHEISDSLFYSDFKKLRESYAEKGFVDTTIAITAADAWLSTFENVPTTYSLETVFRSVSRDTAVDLKNMQKEFFSQVYGIKFTTDDSIKIEKKSSAYYGKYFYYDNDGNSIYYAQWRFKNPIEDTLGLCLLKTKSLVTYKGDEYLCESGSNIWRKNVSHDELLKGYYDRCWEFSNNDAIYVRDSLYVCECDESKNCAWSDKYAGKEVPRTDSAAFAKYIAVKAVGQFGKCYTDGYGALKKLDDVYIQCIDSKWLEVDSLTYYIGHCAKDHVKGEYLGIYYGCRDFADYGAGDTVWAEIPWFVYKDDSCTEKKLKKVNSDGKNYFICEKSGGEKDGSNAEYKWRKLDSAEAIPPVINMDTCENVVPYNYLKKIYDDEYYMCEDGKWHSVDKEKLTAPEKAGDICSWALLNTVKRYDGKYYRCTAINMWYAEDVVTSVSYAYRDSLGSCDTLSNVGLHWNEETSALWSCVRSGDKYQWGKIELQEREGVSLPENIELSRFAGGTRVSPLIYTVDIDGTVYRFSAPIASVWYLTGIVEPEE